MNSFFKFFTNLAKYIGLFFFLVLGNCNTVESEKAYCLKTAEKYFLLCLVDIAASPTYFGKAEWTASEIQSYAQAYCIAEYNRKQQCADQKSYRPHRKD